MKKILTVLAFLLMTTIAAQAAPKHLLSHGAKKAGKGAAKGVAKGVKGAFKAGSVVF